LATWPILYVLSFLFMEMSSCGLWCEGVDRCLPPPLPIERLVYSGDVMGGEMGKNRRMWSDLEEMIRWITCCYFKEKTNMVIMV